MKTATALATTLGLGAGLMYLLDPQHGDRRRAQFGEALADTAETLGDVSREAFRRGRTLANDWSRADVAGPARRWVAQTPLRDLDQPLRDLGQPLRDIGQEIGATLRDPRSFRPAWRDGRLTLRRRGLADTLADYWWVVAGAVAGAAAVVYFVRSSGGRVDVKAEVTVDAPIARVFEAWSRFEDFPRLMSAVREVRTLDGDRTHWVIGGPAGLPVEWDAVTTRFEQDRAIAWKTVRGSLVDHRGTVRFHPVGSDRTPVEVTMSYRPAGGAFGRSVASILGGDPQWLVQDDLERFKSQMEPAHAAAGNGRSR